MTRREMGIPVCDNVVIIIQRVMAFKALALHTVGDVEPDSGEGRSGGECHRTAETGEAKDEIQ